MLFANFPRIQFNNNLLANWKDLDQLQGVTTLQTVYLEHNPIYKDKMYRNKVKLAMPPGLRQIDATYCR